MEQRSRKSNLYRWTVTCLSLLACLLVSGVLNAQVTTAKKAAAAKPQKIQTVSSNGLLRCRIVIVNKNTGVQVMTDEAGNATIQRNVGWTRCCCGR